MRYDSTIEERHCISEAMILIILNSNSSFFFVKRESTYQTFQRCSTKNKAFSLYQEHRRLAEIIFPST